MYKWVDERGVVSYSNTPPPTSSTKKVEAVPERVSVYTPDAELKHALSSEGRKEAKAASLGRQLEAERNARRTPTVASAIESRTAAAYERCLAERRVDCESLRSGVAGDPLARDPLARDPLYGYTGYYPQPVFGARGPLVAPPFFVSDTPPPRVGVSTAPRVGVDDRPPVGAQPRSRTVGHFR